MIVVCGMAEGFTSGKVSALARRAWLEYRGETPSVTFRSCRDGYEMTAWESQIDLCRDFGAARALTVGRAIHRFDMQHTAYSEWQRQREQSG